jgi:hypothetical protein
VHQRFLDNLRFPRIRDLVALNGAIKYQPSNTLVSSAIVSTVMRLVKAAVCVASGCSVFAIIAVLFTATSLYQEINDLHDEIVEDMNAFKVLYFRLHSFMQSWEWKPTRLGPGEILVSQIGIRS